MQRSVHADHNMKDKKALVILVLFASLCGETRGKAIFGKYIDDNNDDGGDTASDLIYKANSKKLKGLFEEDILIDEARRPEVEEWINGITTTKRAAMIGDVRWPKNTLYYQFNPSFMHSKDRFWEAIDEIESNSCIKFKEGQSPEGNYVSVGSADGCYSNVGNTKDGGQELSIGDGCNHKGIIVHEMLHALGFWHEQSRPDRDTYITVIYKNIHPGNDYNFVKHVENEVEELGEPYDYDSVMHYGKKAFSWNGLDTIVPKGDPNRNIGQINGLSNGDAAELRKYYKCPNCNPSPESMNCDFEEGFCLWEDFDGQRSFQIHKGATASWWNTGPSRDHTTGTGDQYIYFETSSPVTEGESALIRSACLNPSDVCVTFWYYMYGNTMGRLEMGTVTDLDSSTLQVKWSREGNQGRIWKQAKVTVESSQLFYIVFKGIRGWWWKSDIALDDIVISSGPC